MSDSNPDPQRLAEVKAFLQETFALHIPDSEPGVEMEAHATLTRKNQPEFYADAPWRLEPDLDEFPLLLVIREANVTAPGKGPWRLDRLHIDQQLNNGGWRRLRSYTPSQLTGVGSDGCIDSGYWSLSTSFALSALAEVDPVTRNQVVRLRISFQGRFPPYHDPDPDYPRRYLHIFLAKHALPLSRAANGGGPRQWFYGDTHYHSAYTNDIWEFGNPVRDARHAGRSIGLDWLVITDHSCDLDDRDNGSAGPTRWDRLQDELAKTSISDNRFRMVPGEEVTLFNSDGGYVHMLAMGPLRQMVPGGFWSTEDTAINWFAKIVNKLIASSGGYPDDAVERLFGQVLDLGQVLALLPSGVVVFAAHPYDPAQPPFFNSKWTQAELEDQRLTGFEFWNGSSRRQTKLLTDPTDDPFSQPEWSEPDKVAKNDKKRASTLQEHVEEKWEPVLCRGVDQWAEGEAFPRLRPVFAGGSDAHGDFNYSVGVGWNYKEHGWISDNALGRVRTVVYLADHDTAGVPTRARLLAALKQGACVVTDGPILECTLSQNGASARVGDVLVVDCHDDAELAVTAHSTPDFGPVQEIVVSCYMQGQQKKKPVVTKVAAGPSATVDLDGRRGFCRVQAWTTGPGGERFCCFTNPLWLRLADDAGIRLRIRLEG